jgi:hypothetical protein
MTNTRRTSVWLAAASAGLFLAGCGGEGDSGAAADPSASPEAPRLEQAYEACRRGSDPEKTLTLGDGGRTLVVDTESKRGSIAGLNCVLREVGTPQSIQAALERTTAMQGVQDAEHQGLSYSWSYHPDNGVNMVIEETE